MAKGWCMGVFQPHRYSRTKYLHEQFADCFEGLDEIVLTDIYGAGELPITGIDGKLIYDVVVKNGGTEAVYIESKNKILEYILPRLKSGDVLVFMGAGDITDIAHKAGEILQVL
jgi:UDP-N-acetylmuramate--alanine ligase